MYRQDNWIARRTKLSLGKNFGDLGRPHAILIRKRKEVGGGGGGAFLTTVGGVGI